MPFTKLGRSTINDIAWTIFQNAGQISFTSSLWWLSQPSMLLQKAQWVGGKSPRPSHFHFWVTSDATKTCKTKLLQQPLWTNISRLFDSTVIVEGNAHTNTLSGVATQPVMRCLGFRNIQTVWNTEHPAFLNTTIPVLFNKKKFKSVCHWNSVHFRHAQAVNIKIRII